MCPPSESTVTDSAAARQPVGEPPGDSGRSGKQQRPAKGPAPALAPLEFARWAWRQLTSMRTALILLFLLAVAAIPGSLIPQTRVDPSAVLTFEQQHPTLAPVFDRLGMFGVYSSIWFSAIYLLLMASLLGCIVPRLRVYLRNVRQRPPKAPRHLSRLSAYETWETSASRTVEAERVERLLSGQRRRIAIYPGDGETVVSAEKGYLREAGNLLFHCAVVVVLVGVAFTGLFGFKGGVAVITGQGFSDTLTQFDDFTPGARFSADNLPPFSFRVHDFHVAYQRGGQAAGMPLTFSADLLVRDQPDSSPYRYDLSVNHPLNVDGVSVFLVGHGYAPVVTVRDGTGHVAFSGPVIFLPQDGTFTSFGVVKVPDASPAQLGFQGYFFPTGALSSSGRPYSAFPGPDNPVLTLVGYRGDLGLDTGLAQSVYVLDKSGMTPLRSSSGQPKALLLRVGQTQQLPDGAGSIRFDGVQTFVKLQVNKQPAKIVPLVGVLAAIVGLLGSLFVRPRRTWVRLRDRDGRTVVEVAALDRVTGGDPAAHVAEVSKALRPKEQQR